MDVAVVGAATRQTTTTTVYLLSFIQIIKLTHKSIGVAKYFTGVTVWYTCFVLSYLFFFILFHSLTLARHSQCEFREKNIDLYTYTQRQKQRQLKVCVPVLSFFNRNYKYNYKIQLVKIEIMENLSRSFGHDAQRAKLLS